MNKLSAQFAQEFDAERNSVSDLGDFQARLRWALTNDPRSNKEIAAAMEVDQSQVSRWAPKSGEGQEIKVGNLQALARALPWLSMDWLVAGRGPRRRGGEEVNTLLAEINHVMVELASDPRASGLVVELFSDGLEILREAQRDLDGEV